MSSDTFVSSILARTLRRRPAGRLPVRVDSGDHPQRDLRDLPLRMRDNPDAPFKRRGQPS